MENTKDLLIATQQTIFIKRLDLSFAQKNILETFIEKNCFDVCNKTCTHYEIPFTKFVFSFLKKNKYKFSIKDI